MFVDAPGCSGGVPQTSLPILAGKLVGMRDAAPYIAGTSSDSAELNIKDL